MKHIKLYELFENLDTQSKWPLVDVYKYYPYSGNIKGDEIIKIGAKGLIEANPFLKAWFKDYGDASGAFEEDPDYDIFEDYDFWYHLDENVYDIMSSLESQGIEDILIKDYFTIIMTEILNAILNDPDYKRPKSDNLISALRNNFENIVHLINTSYVEKNIKVARERAIANLIKQGHGDWEGLEIKDPIVYKELKNSEDLPPYSNWWPGYEGIYKDPYEEYE